MYCQNLQPTNHLDNELYTNLCFDLLVFLLIIVTISKTIKAKIKKTIIIIPTPPIALADVRVSRALLRLLFATVVSCLSILISSMSSDM